MTTAAPPAILSGIIAYVARAQAAESAAYARLCPSAVASGARGPVVFYETGRRYARIFTSTPGRDGRNVHSFVDMATGDILKAASWKSPVKSARGNVLTA